MIFSFNDVNGDEIRFKILIPWTLPNSLGEIDLLTGTGLPERRDENSEEDVAAKHEGEADCFGNSGSVDPHHSPLSLPWVQLREMSRF
jgi:hypothetical protein